MKNTHSTAISIQDLKKTFDESKSFVLDGIDLNIPRGKITIIIGFSGTGKSVLLKHILGLIKPTSGSIEVFDKNIWDMHEEEWGDYHRRLGVLFQNGALFDDLTVMENVCFPLKEYKKNMTKDHILEKAKKGLEQLSLGEEHYEKYPDDLSGGMKKRVALARALILDPEILFYDEPTTGLDPILKDTVSDLIKSTHYHRKDRTSIIISHDIASSFSIGHFIAMMVKGKVLFSGTPNDFMSSKIPLVRTFIEKGLRQL